MNRKSGDRSAWIAASIRARKPSIAGDVLVTRLAGGGYAIELRFEETEGNLTTIPIARIASVGVDLWKLEWTSGDGLWKPLDDVERSLDQVLEAIARDDFGCFFG